jgi:pSer/pThr/pTyr-binding forkhead associated (FHA) protein
MVREYIALFSRAPRASGADHPAALAPEYDAAMSMQVVARHPRITLIPLTPEARAAVGTAAVAVSPLPYRVGRESRGPRGFERIFTREQRWSGAPPTNELYLLEVSEELNVSREHFQIEWDGRGLTLVDRGSTCGTIVEGEQVGGQGQGGTVPLKDGDVIIVGTAFSPFVFKVRLELDSVGPSALVPS